MRTATLTRDINKATEYKAKPRPAPRHSLISVTVTVILCGQRDKEAVGHALTVGVDTGDGLTVVVEVDTAPAAPDPCSVLVSDELVRPLARNFAIAFSAESALSSLSSRSC